MNNINRAVVSLMLVAVMAITMIAGCNKPESENDAQAHSDAGGGSGTGSLQSGAYTNYDPSDLVYVSSIIPFPDEVEIVPFICYGNDKLYFVSTSQYVGGEDEFYSHIADDSLYSMNLDGSEPTRLTHYTPPVTRPQDDYGTTSISKISVDDDGNLWIAEMWEFYGYNLPGDFNSAVDSPFEYWEVRGRGSSIRKLDANGAELLRVDVDGLMGSGSGSAASEQSHITALTTCGGYVYTAIGNVYTDSTDIFVLDSSGNLAFSQPVDGWIYELNILSDGSVAYTDRAQGAAGRVLQKIDAAAGGLGEAVPLPDFGGEINTGGGDFDVLISLGTDLYGYAADGDVTHLLNWPECGVLRDYIQNIQMLPDGRIICTNYRWNRATKESDYELIVVSQRAYSELPQKIVLTLSTFGMPDSLSAAIVDFNRTNPEITVLVNDYLELTELGDGGRDNYYLGLTKLATDIITGNTPDILAISELPFGEYAARGLFADLYPFIDSDPDFNRKDFVQGVLQAAETDGKLYQIFPSFTIGTLVGHPSVVGTDAMWTMQELKALLTEHPQADMPLGWGMTDLTLLQTAVSLGIDGYIDWNSATAYFDSPEFTELLEICRTLPRDERNKDGRLIMGTEYIPTEELIASNRQLLMNMQLDDFFYIQYNKALFGGEITLKAYPGMNGSGVSLIPSTALAITENSPYKEEAWEFVRTVLDKNWQLANCWELPANEAAFSVKAADALAGEFNVTVMGMDLQPITQADIDKVRDLIKLAGNASGGNIDTTIWNIISEEATDYFLGAKTAENAARAIQSRVSLLVAERR